MAKTGATVIDPYDILGVARDAYEAAIKANGGKWPAPEQVAEAMRKK